MNNMLRCTPFLLFDGNCAEAMTFYHECLGGELILTKLGDTPMKAQFPKEKHDRIINAQLRSGKIEISATDWMASPAFDPKQGNTFAVFVIGEAYEELEKGFDKLAAGAEKGDSRSCTKCHSECMGSFMTSMAFTGSLKEI
ncbi:MAG: VOC family protein [Nitrososphaerales archaeon]